MTEGWFQKLTPKVIRNNPYLDMLIDNERGVPTMGKDMRVVTANMFRLMSDKEAREDLHEIADLADIAGIQEVVGDTDRDRLKDVAQSEGFRVWTPNECAIMYRESRFVYHKGQSFRLGSVPIRGEQREKYATAGIFKDLATNRTLGIVNTHMISKAFTDNPERLPYWERMLINLAKAARWADQYSDATIVLGDMNANQHRPDIRARYRRAFGKQIELDNPERGTHGLAIYDWIMRLDNEHTRRISARVFAGHSDHRYVQAVYKWK